MYLFEKVHLGKEKFAFLEVNREKELSALVNYTYKIFSIFCLILALPHFPLIFFSIIISAVNIFNIINTVL